MQRHPARWRTRLASFAGDYTIAALSRDAGISPESVYSWISGRSQPRLSTAERVVKLSGGALTLEDFCRHRQEVGDGIGSQEPRS